MTGLLLSDDLIFTSRITGTGTSLGFSFGVAKNADALLTLARRDAPSCVIIDLANPGLKIAEVVAALKQLAPAPTIVAYGSHVDTATLRAAREAGCDHVMPRSHFVEELAQAMPRWMSRSSGEPRSPDALPRD
jgi:DNA-binding NarL/FixJ family response regulator